jgi:glycosyltransferase involved in cell wall biosynthesis
MRILEVINSLSAGGAETIVVSLACSLRKLGADVTVFAYAGALDERGAYLADQLREAGIPVVMCNARSLWAWIAVSFRMAYIIYKFKPDIIHSHLEQSDFFSALAKKLVFGGKVLHARTIHNVYATKRLPKFVHRFLRGAIDLHIACGRSALNSYPYLSSRACVIENGIRISTKEPVARRSIRGSLSIPAQAYVALCVGAFSSRNQQLQKAQDVIIKALKLVPDKDIYIVFAGDGEHRNDIEQMAGQLGVAERCRFLGRVVDVSELFEEADVFLMPSRFEGMPIACIEALCWGMPAILSDIPAFDAFRSEGVYFVPVDDSDQLSKALVDAKRNRAQLSFAAKKDSSAYSKRFDIKNISEQYLHKFELLLKPDRGL